MKKSLLLFTMLFICGNAISQTYLKVADKPEYEKYLKYCVYPIERDFYIQGKVNVLKVNGQYSDSIGNCYVSKHPSFVFYPIGVKTITFEPNQRMVIVKVTLTVKRREPSIFDFYKYWKTNFIQEGLIDERSGIK